MIGNKKLRKMGLITFVIALIAGCAKPEVKRIGMVIKLKPEVLTEYKRLHADSYSGVRDLLTKYNMRNFNIFLHQLDDGNWYEFGYYEYVGDDYEASLCASEKR